MSAFAVCTWLSEPELIADSGQLPPAFTAAEIFMARSLEAVAVSQIAPISPRTIHPRFRSLIA